MGYPIAIAWKVRNCRFSFGKRCHNYMVFFVLQTNFGKIICFACLPKVFSHIYIAMYLMMNSVVNHTTSSRRNNKVHTYAVLHDTVGVLITLWIALNITAHFYSVGLNLSYHVYMCSNNWYRWLATCLAIFNIIIMNIYSYIEHVQYNRFQACSCVL